MFADWYHAMMVAMWMPFCDANKVLSLMPGTIEGVPNIAGV